MELEVAEEPREDCPSWLACFPLLLPMPQRQRQAGQLVSIAYFPQFWVNERWSSKGERRDTSEGERIDS